MNGILHNSQIKYLESLRKEKNQLILKMEEYARKNNVPILDWKAAEFLETLVLALRPQKVLEIGTAIAYSSIRIACSLRNDCSIDTIEKSKDNIELALKNIEESGFGDKINIVKGDALDIIPNLEEKYDFIFLDADKEDYKKLFDYSVEKLNKDGVLFIDNLLWKGYAGSAEIPEKYINSTESIRNFNQYFLASNQLFSTIVPIGDGIGLGVKQ
ncbi:MAG: O-methyltransferase [Melioribacteraceae bacterium]|nr:O-methyltransferase [Melioribacteraceae bacterium]